MAIKPFWPRTNLSKMFLFPRLHYGESIIDFKKSTFFRREAIFHPVRELPGPFCASNLLMQVPIKIENRVENSKKC